MTTAGRRHTGAMETSRRVTIAALADAAVVMVFVAIGRRSHDEGSALRGLVETAAPFLLGLTTAWLAARSWQNPFAVRTALMIWPVTVAVGMVLRRVVFDDGTAPSFIVVATTFLGLFLLGWRMAVSPQRRRPPASATR